MVLQLLHQTPHLPPPTSLNQRCCRYIQFKTNTIKDDGWSDIIFWITNLSQNKQHIKPRMIYTIIRMTRCLQWHSELPSNIKSKGSSDLWIFKLFAGLTHNDMADSMLCFNLRTVTTWLERCTHSCKSKSTIRMACRRRALARSMRKK